SSSARGLACEAFGCCIVARLLRLGRLRAAGLVCVAQRIRRTEDAETALDFTQPPLVNARDERELVDAVRAHVATSSGGRGSAAQSADTLSMVAAASGGGGAGVRSTTRITVYLRHRGQHFGSRTMGVQRYLQAGRVQRNWR